MTTLVKLSFLKNKSLNQLEVLFKYFTNENLDYSHVVITIDDQSYDMTQKNGLKITHFKSFDNKNLYEHLNFEIKKVFGLRLKYYLNKLYDRRIDYDSYVLINYLMKSIGCCCFFKSENKNCITLIVDAFDAIDFIKLPEWNRDRLNISPSLLKSKIMNILKKKNIKYTIDLTCDE